jgi:plasmid stabilization system protein ParE
MTEASIFYEAASRGLGLEFLIDVQRAIDAVRERPKVGRPISPNLRQWRLRRFPYSLIYAEEPDAILIIAVAHQRRRPRYWRDRR